MAKKNPNDYFDPHTILEGHELYTTGRSRKIKASDFWSYSISKSLRYHRTHYLSYGIVAGKRRSLFHESIRPVFDKWLETLHKQEVLKTKTKTELWKAAISQVESLEIKKDSKLSIDSEFTKEEKFFETNRFAMLKMPHQASKWR